MSSLTYLLEHLVPLTLGAILVGTMMSCLFTGLLWAVAWQYAARFQDDRRLYQAIALFMLVLGTVDTCFNASYAWDALISHFGDELFVLNEPWQFGSMIAFVGVGSLVLQSFLCFRIYVVSAKRWRVYPALSLALSLASAGLSWYIAIWFNQQPTSESLLDKAPLVWAWFGMSSASELMSTVALIWFLVIKPRRISRNVTNLPSQGLLRRLVFTAVETNMLALAFHIAIIVTYARYQTTGFWYAGPGFSMTKVYGISLFSTLLSRSSDQSGFGQSSNSAKNFAFISQEAASGAQISIQQQLNFIERETVPYSAPSRIEFPPPGARSEVEVEKGIVG